MYKNTSNVERIDIHTNRLTSFDFASVVENNPELKELRIDNNNIAKLENVTAIPSKSDYSKILLEIRDNPIACDPSLVWLVEELDRYADVNKSVCVDDYEIYGEMQIAYITVNLGRFYLLGDEFFKTVCASPEYLSNLHLGCLRKYSNLSNQINMARLLTFSALCI